MPETTSPIRPKLQGGSVMTAEEFDALSLHPPPKNRKHQVIYNAGQNPAFFLIYFK